MAEAESETPRPPQTKKYSDAEAKEIYETAAEIQSDTLFPDEEEGFTADQLASGARRAGISDRALEAAIAAEAREDAQEDQEKRLAAQRKAQFRRNALMVGSVVAGMVLLGAVSTQARLGKKRAEVETQTAQIENVLQRRHDLIPNLISVTKATLDNQRELIASINTAQKAVQEAQTPEAKQAAETTLSKALKRTTAELQIQSDNSPAALRLIDEMAGTENRIAQERRRYNSFAADYNRTARGFPTSVFRPLLRYPASYPLFQAESGARDVPRF